MASYVTNWQTSNPDDYITCYIYNLITDKKIQFKTIPEDINETYSAEWQANDVLGRSAPYIAYGGNPARTVDYSVKLDRNIIGDPDFQDTVDECIKLVYPDYADNGIVIPPYCYIRFGGVLKMYAVVDNVSVAWSGPIISDTETQYATDESKDPNRNLYAQADISFSFTEIRTYGQSIPTGSSLHIYDTDY